MPTVFVSLKSHNVTICCAFINNTFFNREKYKNPRVLSCLHVLCENCLKDLLAVETDEEGCDNVIYSGRNKPHRAFIVCPLCKQETAVCNFPCTQGQQDTYNCYS